MNGASRSNEARANALTNEAAAILGSPWDAQELPVATLEHAGDLLEQAFKLLPDHPRSMFNVGNIRDELSLSYGGPFVSKELYERALKLRRTPECLLNLGRILDIQEGRHKEALELYEQSVIQQGLYRGAYGMGVCMLMQACRTDDPNLWRHGWYWFEHRKGMNFAEVKNHPARWRGEALEGKRLLIYTDSGLGDQIWAMRWVKLAKEQGAHTIVVCSPQLQQLFSEQSYVDECHSEGDGYPLEFDYITYGLSMATYMDPTAERRTVDPYLQVRSANIGIPLAPLHRKRVGLCWRGSTSRGYAAWRNIPLGEILDHVPRHLTYVSLQKPNEGEPQLVKLGPRWQHLDVDLDSIHECADMCDTAALIESCDLVVTIGSALSMLAPALGVETWVLNTFNSAWQFGPWSHNNSADPQWFRGIVQFRQGQDRQWGPVLTELGQCLSTWGGP